MWPGHCTRIVLNNGYSLGDVVMLTAAVRDLHRLHPGRYLTEVRSGYPELWLHNPYITEFGSTRGTIRIDCDVPLIQRSNQQPWHYLHAIPELLSRRLGVSVHPTEFNGDIHVAREEKSWLSQVGELAGRDIPFWILVSGGKFDITLKWWNPARLQQVVDHFKGRIQFVQVGDLGNHHPKISGTVDLRGRTQLRQLIRLMYHASGVLCPVTSLMHLAAAVPFKGRGRRPCVVVAGGREPAHWEAYPGHQFLHTIGQLPCCASGGCWRDRVEALGDGDRRDLPRNLCVDVTGGFPRCMEMVQAEDVIRAIEGYIQGGRTAVLDPSSRAAARKAIRASDGNPFDQHCIHLQNAAEAAATFLETLPPPPNHFHGRGIVIPAGGSHYFTNAYICARMLRHHGCRLPIQFWHIGLEELDDEMRRIAAELDVECVDGERTAFEAGLRPLSGWELKIVAILHSRFQEILLLDADNVPLRDPEYLFDSAEWHEHGAVFWPDYRVLEADRLIWKLCGLKPMDAREFETGQLMVDKRRCWTALQLCQWYNDRSDFFYRHVHGDKETFHMAFRRAEKSFALIPTPIKKLRRTMGQHDFEGRLIFLHRNLQKWRLFGPNPSIPGFEQESRCLAFLADLETRWNGFIQHRDAQNHRFRFRPNTNDADVFNSVALHNEYGLPERLAPEDCVLDIGAHIGSFSYACLSRGSHHVSAWEADPENAARARQNLEVFGRRVKLHHAAVLRSDEPPTPRKVAGYPTQTSGVNTGGGVFSTAITTPDEPSVSGVALDQILRNQPRWAWVKMDCEGSEWPLLFTSKELHRIDHLCGEYHLLDEVPSAWKINGVKRFDATSLRAWLRKHFRHVRTVPTKGTPLGHFEASEPLNG